MRLEWLEDIMAIAETGSFSGAAERRLLTQSAFSRRVQQIEEYVGVELFDRDYKPIRLKQTTIAQSEQIAQLAAGMRQLVTDLRRGERLASNKVVIACQHSLTTMRVPSLIQQMPTEREGIYVKLRSANSDECTGLLLSRQADVAIVYRVAEEHIEFGTDFLEELLIGKDRLIPVYHKPLERMSDDPSSIMEIPCVTYPTEVFFGQIMERRILPVLGARVQHVPKVETALTLAAVELAAIGIGIAWVPESLALDRIARNELIDLSSILPSVDLQIKAMRLQGKSNPAEGAFWRMLKKS